MSHELKDQIISVKKLGLILVSLFLVTYVAVVNAGFVYGQDEDPTPEPAKMDIEFDIITGKQGLGTELTTIGGILNKATDYIFTAAGLILLVSLVASGFSYLTSSGDPKKLETAKSRIVTSLIGFIVVIIAFWLVEISIYIFNLGSDTGGLFGN